MTNDNDLEIESVIPTHVQTILNFINSVALTNAAKDVPPHLWDLSDYELERMVGCSKVAFQVRNALLQVLNVEVTRGQKAGIIKVQLSDICSMAGFSYQHVYNLLKEKPEIIVFILRPIRDLREQGQVLLETLLSQISEIAAAPIDWDKKFNGKLFNLKLGLWKFLDSKYGHLMGHGFNLYGEEGTGQNELD